MNHRRPYRTVTTLPLLKSGGNAVTLEPLIVTGNNAVTVTVTLAQ